MITDIKIHYVIFLILFRDITIIVINGTGSRATRKIINIIVIIQGGVFFYGSAVCLYIGTAGYQRVLIAWNYGYFRRPCCRPPNRSSEPKRVFELEPVFFISFPRERNAIIQIAEAALFQYSGADYHLLRITITVHTINGYRLRLWNPYSRPFEIINIDKISEDYQEDQDNN
jgi:hypothetical protein